MDKAILLKRKKFYKWMFFINVVLYSSLMIFLWNALDTPDKMAKPTIISILVLGFILSLYTTAIRPYLVIRKLLKNL